METLCRDEVIALHQFFEGWFTGRLARHEAVFERCCRALAPGFRLLSPRAVVHERQPLLDALWQAHGKKARLRIWIEELACQPVAGRDDLALVTYQEWQDEGGAITCRLSSALMAADADAPGGVVWLHVHETWAPDAAARAEVAPRDEPADPVLARFEAGRLPPEEFDHAMHVQVAWRYVRSYPMLDALARFIRALRRFVAAHGKEGMYHETITWAYMLLIHERMVRAGEMDWPAFVANNPDLLASGKRVLERYYRADTLWSDVARAHFVFPDRGFTPGNDGE